MLQSRVLEEYEQTPSRQSSAPKKQAGDPFESQGDANVPF